VIPHSGDVQGECLSGIWKFSVNVSHESDVLLDFVRDVDPLEIFQGMNETFNITIINNGGENVQVRLSGSGALAGNVELPRDITAFVGLNRISIIISIPGDLEPGSYDLTLRMSFNSGSKDLILPVSVKKFKESDDDGDSGSASGQKGRIGRTWLWILTGAIVLLIIIVGLVYFLKGRKEEREPVQEEFGRAPKTVNIRAKERMGPSGSCKATGYKIIDPKLSSEVITREQIRAKMSREEQRRRVGGKKPVPARVPVKESRVRGPDPKAATAQNAAPVVVSDKSQKIISPKGTDLVIRTLPVATKEIRKIKRLPESKTAASVSAAVPETSKEPEGGKSKVEEMNDLFDELKNGLPGMLGEDANIFLENGDMLNILSELDNLRKKAVESEEGEPGVEDEEPAGEERGEPASELYEAPATGVHEAPVSEEYEAPASEEYEAPDESTASIDEGIVLEEQQDLGHEDEKIEIGWDDEEKETGEENTDLEEKTEDVPERVDESESGEAIEDENGKALAKIPIRRVAISKETGEELNKCDSCGKYYDHTWDACPNCSGGSQSASGKTGLDPTDKEAEDESGESPRRYPEEEIFDDDLNLEDIIEGM